MAKTSARVREKGGTLMGEGSGENRDSVTWSKKESPARAWSDWPKAIAVQGPDTFSSSSIQQFGTTFSG